MERDESITRPRARLSTDEETGNATGAVRTVLIVSSAMALVALISACVGGY